MTTALPDRPTHIAMVSIPAPGHINPNLEVIRELVRRGHRVTYAIPESFAEAVAATGAEPLLYTSALPMDGDPGEEYVDQIQPFLTDNIQMLPQLSAAYQGDEPDLVLYDIATFCVRILARRWHVPAVQLSPCQVAWEGYRQDMAPMIEALRQDPRGRAYEQRFAQWLAEEGVTEWNSDTIIASPDRSLVLISRSMQPHADRVDDSVFTFVGSCQADRSDQGTWRRPAALAPDDKVLLVSLGSAFTNVPEFYRACLAAFGDLPGWYVVLQIGAFVDEADLGPLPTNVEVHRWVAQLAILRQADAFVTHAGMGGSQEGLSCGVPMVAVPQGADQFANADLLENLGVGRHIPMAEATPERLRTAVLDLTADPEVAERLAAIQQLMDEEGGAPLAADLIEKELAAPRTPVDDVGALP